MGSIGCGVAGLFLQFEHEREQEIARSVQA